MRVVWNRMRSLFGGATRLLITLKKAPVVKDCATKTPYAVKIRESTPQKMIAQSECLFEE